MDRRTFLQTSAGLGALSVATTITSRGAAATGSEPDQPDQPATSEPATTVSIPSGQRVKNQAQYDDGTRPDSPPTYEPLTRSVDAETVETVTAGRRLTGALRQQLSRIDQTTTNSDLLELAAADGAASATGTGADDGADSVGPISISRRYDTDGLTLFIDCPPGADTGRLADSIGAISGRVQEAIDGTQLARLDGIDVQVRERPTATPERNCEQTVGRFADSQYREEGIAMGAAVRSEAIGETASTGFRGLCGGRAVVITTAHTFQSITVADAADIRGDRLYQSRRPHDIGRCHAVGWRDDPPVDAAAAAVDTDTYPSRYLADPGGDNYDDRPIIGAASWDLLETALVEERPIYRQGAVTGRCEGRLSELREFDNGYRELDVDIHSGGGDSGGPYFLAADDGLLVAAIHKGTRGDGPMKRAVFVGSILEALDTAIY